jgi:2-dehydropantoate 2-reductase
MRAAIMGVGSLGTIMGALMTKNGADVILIDANKEHVNAMNAAGAKIVGKLNLTVPVKAITPIEMTGIYDVVFYLVKQTANSVALKQLLPHWARKAWFAPCRTGCRKTRWPKRSAKNGPSAAR